MTNMAKNGEVRIDVKEPPHTENPKTGTGNEEAQDAESDQGSESNFRTCCMILCTTMVGLCVILLFANIVSLIPLIIGWVYLHECPEKNMIPIALIGEGIIHILQVVLKYWKVMCGKQKMGSENVQEKSWPQRFLGYISVGWFINGTIAVYTVYDPNYRSDLSPIYCNKVLFKFAFWYYTLFCICAFLAIGCYICYRRSK